MSGEKQDDLSRLEIISTIESWWGHKFDEALIKHILFAPRSHIVEFNDYLLNGGPRSRLTAARKGVLRPLVNISLADVETTGDDNIHLTRIPTLSLYSHEILVEPPRIFFSDFKYESDVIDLGVTLRQMLKLKPLIDIGVVEFYLDPMRSKNRHPSRNLLTRAALEEADNPSEVSEAFSKLDNYMSSLDTGRATSLFFYGSNDVSYLLRTATNSPGFFNICKQGHVSSMCLDLLLAASGLTKRDRGAQNLNKLLTLDVPQIGGMTNQIASLRGRSDEFAEWRSRLGAALSSLDDIDESNEDWIKDARGVLADELSPISERLRKAVKRSPALQAASSGTRTFSLAGIGTLTSGLMGGPLALPAAGLATAKAVEAVATYIGARKEYRAQKAVLDVLMAFEDLDG